MAAKGDNFTFRLPERMRADLETIRDRGGGDTSLADVVRRALRELIARELGEDAQPAPGSTNPAVPIEDDRA